MHTLYVNNFRGFKSTFLSLKDINFFVGENSTGKTSILKLIGILCSPGFWRYNEFGNKDTVLGNFSEILSSNVRHKEYFEIGILGDSDNEDSNLAAIKLRFIEQDNLPYLKEIWFINGDANIQASIEGKFLKYKFAIVKSNENPLKKNKYFISWISKNGLDKKELHQEEIEFSSIKSILAQLESSIALLRPDVYNKSNPLKINLPFFLGDVAWIAPARSEPQRIYDNNVNKFQPEGEHSPYILKDILDGKNVKKIIKKFGVDSDLFDDIKIEKLSNRLGRVEPFQILIKLEGHWRNLANVGYGVSQILPLIVEVIARPDKTWFAIQQPEIHLHPKAQAAFGDFIFKSYEKDNQKFIIETHSDYTIDRFRLKINRALRKKAKVAEDIKSQIVFFSRNKNGNQLESLEIQKDGSFPGEQPVAFREFFIREQLDLIKI